MPTIEEKIDLLLSLVTPKPKTKDESKEELQEWFRARRNKNKLKRLTK